MYFPELLEEYKQLLQQMKADGIKSGSMYQEVKQAIEWMETGYDPAEYRAATRVDAYPMDPYHMQTYISYINDDDEMLLPDYLQAVHKKLSSNLCAHLDPLKADKYVKRFFRDFARLRDMSYKNKKIIKEALQGLSDNEKATFIALRAERMTMSKVAEMLGIKRTTVQSYVVRAEKKIKKNIEQAEQGKKHKSAA